MHKVCLTPIILPVAPLLGKIAIAYDLVWAAYERYLYLAEKMNDRVHKKNMDLIDILPR